MKAIAHGRARARRARAAGRGDPRGPGRRARRGDPDDRGGLGGRDGARAGQARRGGAQRGRDRHRRGRRHARSRCSSATASTPRCCCAATTCRRRRACCRSARTASRPAFHVVGANGTYGPDDVDWDAIADATHLHLGGPEFMGGEAAAEILAHARERGVTPPPTSSRRATRASSSGSRRRCRTSTTSCPTTSRCSASPATTDLDGGCRALARARRRVRGRDLRRATAC